MLLYFCFIAALIIGILLSIIGDKKFKEPVLFSGLIIAIISGILFGISSIVIIDSHVGQDVKLQAKQAERDALVWQIEHDKYDGSGNAIGKFNKDVIENKLLVENPWFNWMTDQYYSEVETINLDEYTQK